MGRFPIHIIGLGRQVEILTKIRNSMQSSAGGENVFGMFSGGGLEFKDHREYTFKDDSRHIDWKASLRSDRLLVKEFLPERGVDVVFVYDVSETMLFGSQKKIKAHYGAEFILTLAGSILESNYNVGLVCFSDKINYSFLPASGKNQLGIFLDVLGNHSTYGGKFDLLKALDFVDSTYGEEIVVILVSDFLGNKVSFDRFKNKFKYLCKKFDFVCVILRDQRDEFMPSGNMNLVISDPNDQGHLFFNTKKIKKRYEQYTKKQKIVLKKFLDDVNSDHFDLYTNKSFIDPTIGFFRRRDALSK